MDKTTTTETTATEISPEQVHESNKVTRQALAFAHYVFKNRLQFMHEEFSQANQTLTVLETLCRHLQVEIEKVEPPEKVEAEPKRPYVMEVPLTNEKIMPSEAVQ